MKEFHGKVIYNPSGKAGEYSYWAANFYNGCSARCTYCYNRKGITAKVLGGDVPTLKKCLKDEETAFKIFRHEALKNILELQKHGLFFNFVSDPCLRETINLNSTCWHFATGLGIPVKILTKQTWWVNPSIEAIELPNKLISIGFTLTGHDELEPGAATNQERIEAMKKLHDAGFKTWASIEPIIDFKSSFEMIENCEPYCDFFKIGLKSGDRHHYEYVRMFLESVFELIPEKPIYLKDSLLKQAGVERGSIDLPSNYVTRNFNL